MSRWEIELEGEGFEKFFLTLPEYEQAVLTAAIERVLAVLGPDICNGEWGKALGRGLYEFRVRRSLRSIMTEAREPVPENIIGADRKVLLRVFCTFYGDRIILVLGGYNKQKDPSQKRQNKEIKQARIQVEAWRASRRAERSRQRKGRY